MFFKKQGIAMTHVWPKNHRDTSRVVAVPTTKLLYMWQAGVNAHHEGTPQAPSWMESAYRVLKSSSWSGCVSSQVHGSANLPISFPCSGTPVPYHTPCNAGVCGNKWPVLRLSGIPWAKPRHVACVNRGHQVVRKSTAKRGYLFLPDSLARTKIHAGV